MNWQECEIVFKNKMMTINNILFVRYPFETKEQVLEVVEQYLNGMPCTLIAKRYNVHNHKLRAIRKALNLPIQHGGFHFRGKKLEEKRRYKEIIYKDIVSGIDIEEISKKYNRSRQYINTIKREGIKWSSKK